MASMTLYKAKLQNIITQAGKAASPVFLNSTERELRTCVQGPLK